MLKKIVLILLIFIHVSIIAKEQKEIDVKKLSEAIGHVIGKNLEDFGVELDLKQLHKGIKNAVKNKSSSIKDKECLESLNNMQKNINEKISVKNLKQANAFLTKNALDKDIIEIDKNKLQYKVLKKGKSGSLKPYNIPIVKLTGKYLDGKVFTKTNEALILSETHSALQKALIGMKENEKRQIFIHPELIIDSDLLNLNSLVIYDIQIIKIDTKKQPLDHLANQKTIL